MLSQLACWGCNGTPAVANAPGFGGWKRLVQSAGEWVDKLSCTPDVLGIWIMDIDELAHTLGVVFCGSPFGDLTYARADARRGRRRLTFRCVYIAVGAFDLAGLAGIGWRTRR